MERLRLAPAIALLLTASAQGVEIAEGHDAVIGFEAGYVHTSGLPSWTNGYAGKLRFDEDGLVLTRAYLDYRGRIADTLDARVALEAHDDDVGSPIDYTQAYLEWRPLPRSATRYRLKIGTFYPRISLENTDPGWSSPYTLSSSAINTWVAEELRSTGAELTISRRPARLGGAHTLSLSLAAFLANDVAGTLLAWKGWSIHDRQSRPSDDLPLPPVPQLTDGVFVGRQDLWSEPFLELDDKVGYSVNAEWRWGRRLLIRGMYFDNRAEPTARDRGQYGWYTKFSHLGVQAGLPGDVGLLGQVMSGSTAMGPRFTTWHVVDLDYDAWYLMLTRLFGRHRIALRYDDFEACETDELPDDNNSENGDAWTLNYQFTVSDKFTLALEWLQIRTRRPAFVYLGLAERVTERQGQVVLRMRF